MEKIYLNDELVIDIDNLYKIYYYKELNTEYYSYNFLNNVPSNINKNVINDILNTLDNKTRYNLHMFIARQVSLLLLKLKDINDSKLTKLTSINLYFKEQLTIEEFDKLLFKITQNNTGMYIFIINNIIKFLYPVNI